MADKRDEISILWADGVKCRRTAWGDRQQILFYTRASEVLGQLELRVVAMQDPCTGGWVVSTVELPLRRIAREADCIEQCVALARRLADDQVRQQIRHLEAA